MKGIWHVSPEAWESMRDAVIASGMVDTREWTAQQFAAAHAAAAGK